jgi:hypothetical protein
MTTPGQTPHGAAGYTVVQTRIGIMLVQRSDAAKSQLREQPVGMKRVEMDRDSKRASLLHRNK